MFNQIINHPKPKNSFFSRHYKFSSSGQFEHVDDVDLDDETLIICRDDTSTVIAQSTVNGSNEEDIIVYSKSSSTSTAANMSTAQLLLKSRQYPDSTSAISSASNHSIMDGNSLLNIPHKQKRSKAKNDHAKYDLG